MKNSYKIALAIVIVSVMLGTAAGLLVQEGQPRDQVFTFTAKGFNEFSAVSCPNVPRNFTNWLQILVLGNRTGMDFISTEIFSQSPQVQLNLPLNQTAFVYYNQVNSSLEKIDVPLASYFSAGDVIDVSVNYFISGYTPTTFTIGPRIPIVSSDFSC